SEECPASSTRSPNIGITAQNGSQVAAVVLIGSTVHGDVNVTTGPGSAGSQVSVSQYYWYSGVWVEYYRYCGVWLEYFRYSGVWVEYYLYSGWSIIGNEHSVFSIAAEYKEFIVKAYETVEEYNSLPGDYTFLNERYVDLLMIQKHREVKERQQELCSKGQKLQKVLNSRDGDEYQRTSTHQLFSPDGRGCVPQAVLLQGNSGSGKSFTVQKILLDWASGSLYPDQFDFVFHLKCKELNEEEDTSLEKHLLSCGIKPEHVTEVLRSPGRLLFLIDGFDELRLQNTPRPHFAIALLQRKKLPQCFLLVTTRSTATPALRRLLRSQHRFVEILGFSEKGVEEYFQKFFKDEKEALSRRALECVKTNQNLFTACFIPVFLLDHLHVPQTKDPKRS
ncbi:hypothetical protein NFI96_024027, partial [Prochilodus magdalenae]